MYRAKEGGRNRIVMFDPHMREQVANRMALTMSLRHATDRDELRLLYQPQFACVGDHLVGVEALVRWQHPEKGLVLPGEFIEAAEESGIIVEIGRWVLDEACRQAAEWMPLRQVPFAVSVNISPRQLVSRGLLASVKSALDRHGLPADRLCLEITEGALMQDPELAAETLKALRELGVSIAVDDFGTGYSSLAYLQRFPVTALKVDRSFVARLSDTPKTAALVRGIVQLGRALGQTTIAEGVETTEHLEAVTAAGCDAFQGYLRSRPVPADVIATLVRSTPA
jgi:EAL domain-containing protein (putative c-di-GMP-specific phosphodiesterase class I)